MGKESNLPFVQGCPSLQEETLSNGNPNENSDDLEHDAVQYKTEETNTLWTESQPKITSKND